MSKEADAVVNECDVCAAFGRAPHLPEAGTSLVSAITEKVQLDSSFLGNLIPLRTMDLVSV